MAPKNDTSPQQQTLDQGLRFLNVQLHTVPSVAVIVLVGVGSRYETAIQSGIAHFMEHMAFKGTDKRPSSLDIAAAVDGIGGEFNAFTGKEYTGFYIKSAAKDLDLCLDLLSDIIFHSRLDPEEINRERGVIIEEMNMYLDTPTDRVGEIFAHTIYPNQPLGRDIIGQKDTLLAINQSDLSQFNHQWYRPDNMVVAVVGNAEQTDLDQAVSRAFSQRSAQSMPQFQAADTSQSKPQLQVKIKETDQTHLVIGVRAYPLGHPRRYALALLNTILGGNMSSRLFNEVREKRGLAYAVHTNTDEYIDAGSLNCQVGLDHSRLHDAVAVILEQFAALKAQPVSDQELERAKNYLRGRMALSLEDPLGLGLFHARQWLQEGKIKLPSQIMAEVDAVTVADIQAVAQEIMVGQGLNAAVIGPKIDKAALAHLLSL